MSVDGSRFYAQIPILQRHFVAKVDRAASTLQLCMNSLIAKAQRCQVHVRGERIRRLPETSWETVEVLRWAARRSRRGVWQGGSEAHPLLGLQRASDAARCPFCFAPHELRRFWRWPTLLARPRSLRISALRSRLCQHQNRQQRGPSQYFNSLLRGSARHPAHHLGPLFAHQASPRLTFLARNALHEHALRLVD